MSGRSTPRCVCGSLQNVLACSPPTRPQSQWKQAQSRPRSLQRVVVDTSAAVSLALLEPGAAEQLIGSCQSIVTTDQIVGDTFHAVDSFALRSDTTLVWNADESRPVLHVTPDGQVSGLRRTLGRAADIVRSMPRVARPELRALPGLPAGRGAERWLTALDHAKEHDLVLWCDDRALRTFARSAGVPAHSERSPSSTRANASRPCRPQEATALKAELLRHFYMDIPFSSDLYRFAAQADGWHARGVSCRDRTADGLERSADAVRLVLDAVAQVIDSEPDHASAWLAAAYAGLWRATLPSHRSSNLQKLSVQALTQPWVSDSSLPFLLSGLHNGAAERFKAVMVR